MHGTKATRETYGPVWCKVRTGTNKQTTRGRKQTFQKMPQEETWNETSKDDRKVKEPLRENRMQTFRFLVKNDWKVIFKIALLYALILYLVSYIL